MSSAKCTPPQKRCGEKEITAWRDYLGLYENTINQHNQTFYDLDGTNFDTQTWLSAVGLTNVETYGNDFLKLGVRDFILMSNNVLKLICNSLALHNNNDMADRSGSYSYGFPTWVSVGDWRLLHVEVPSVDAVVAQDGSGQYRTIQVVVDVVARRSSGRWGRRFVIHMKSGIYRENVNFTDIFLHDPK